MSFLIYSSSITLFMSPAALAFGTSSSHCISLFLFIYTCPFFMDSLIFGLLSLSSSSISCIHQPSPIIYLFYLSYLSISHLFLCIDSDSIQDLVLWNRLCMLCGGLEGGRQDWAGTTRQPSHLISSSYGTIRAAYAIYDMPWTLYPF